MKYEKYRRIRIFSYSLGFHFITVVFLAEQNIPEFSLIEFNNLFDGINWSCGRATTPI